MSGSRATFKFILSLNGVMEKVKSVISALPNLSNYPRVYTLFHSFFQGNSIILSFNDLISNHKLMFSGREKTELSVITYHMQASQWAINANVAISKTNTAAPYSE